MHYKPKNKLQWWVKIFMGFTAVTHFSFNTAIWPFLALKILLKYFKVILTSKIVTIPSEV